jgi:hypothetical protein
MPPPIKTIKKLNGMKVRRLPDTRLHIERGDFSTCNDSTHQHFISMAVAWWLNQKKALRLGLLY